MAAGHVPMQYYNTNIFWQSYKNSLTNLKSRSYIQHKSFECVPKSLPYFSYTHLTIFHTHLYMLYVLLNGRLKHSQKWESGPVRDRGFVQIYYVIRIKMEYMELSWFFVVILRPSKCLETPPFCPSRFWTVLCRTLAFPQTPRKRQDGPRRATIKGGSFFVL